MVFPDLSQIKKRRQRLLISEKTLAESSGVSQSTIAKIEYGSINPSYDIVSRIFSALDEIEAEINSKKGVLKCSDIMTKKVIMLEPNDNVKKAVNAFKNFSISQLPVMENGKLIGKITTDIVYKSLLKIPQKKLFSMLISDIMQESFPVLYKDVSVENAFPLFNETDAVLLADKGNIVGIITKEDIF